MNLNPFKILFESEKYPAARIRRSPFYGRVIDTLYILHGSYDNDDIGLIDFIFPFARLSLTLTRFLDENKAASNPIVRGLYYLSWIPTVLLEGIKLLGIALLTLASLPISGLVHGILYRNQQKNIETISEIPITQTTNRTSEKITLGKKYHYSDMLDMMVKKITNNSANNIELEIVENSKFGAAKVTTIEVKPENKKVIQALLALNMFDTTDQLERKNLLDNVLQKIDGPTLR